AAEAAGYDALLVVGRSFYDRPGDLAYLTNHFPPFPTTVFSDANRGMGHAFLLLSVEGAAALLTDPRKHRPDLVAVDDVRAAADLGSAVIELLRETGLERGRVGLVGDDILPAAFDRAFAAALPGLRLDPEPGIVAALRRIKSPAEQALMRRAALCADAALSAAVEMIRRGGVTEREVCASAIAAGMRSGADFVRYFRVHSGPWSSYGSRWPQAMDRPIARGEVVAVDAIGAYQGYQFDVNRTTVCGPPDAERLRLLETTLEATNRAVEACVAGARVAEVAAAASRVAERSPFANAMAPMMGHGIGLETVELPYVQHDDPTELLPGMTLCIEPGIFIPEWAGASIEIEVIVRESGPPEVITPTAGRLW
ncbi:MAG: aminopeptidase P family protein, partial [Thermomicrobiales bacterium]|nr:aminopeptidase P family protein [Thermomicrobiales bacterium]